VSTVSPLIAKAINDAVDRAEEADRQRKKAERYRDDPVAFCREVLQFEPWSKQRLVLESVRDHVRTAVRSSHGTGKSAVAARAVLWFLTVHGDKARVITTAPTWNLVRDVLWSEIGAAHRIAGEAIGGTMSATRLELGPRQFAVGLSTDRAERFQGHHEENLLIVVDEASGVSEDIFEAALGYMSGGNARLLLIGNPTQLAGEFYAAFHGHAPLYNRIHISTLDTPAFTGEEVSERVLAQLPSHDWLGDLRAMYGGDQAEQNPVFQVRALGEFPSVADDNVVPLGKLEAAYRREQPLGLPVVIAVDVARFGSDETVLAIRHGRHVRVQKVLAGKSTMEVTGEVVAAARAVRDEGVDWPLIVIDDAGVGGGVTDRLRELASQGVFQGGRIVAYNGGQRARQHRDYPNRRSELWFTFSEQLDELDLDGADQQLTADLVAPKYAIDSQARRVLEAKEHTKRRLGRSPDRGDAVVMCFADRYRPSGTSTIDLDESDDATDPLEHRRRPRQRDSFPLPGSSL
jgi:phage terminase large subunit